eukprot:CAMPEP_0182797442 /NCGR_PEP_ID=MMETSP0006_2-20121128/812_1 /TAXON_ID=97485 /ORGANISM="Prymnesium parvum, Strain Texoma1" /LENGTH=56 /DNA_ID=CAMNT_0024922479 /DNA_START=46 /DNA_END=216 /DNA_ORIENTATION=+
MECTLSPEIFSSKDHVNEMSAVLSAAEHTQRNGLNVSKIPKGLIEKVTNDKEQKAE